MADDEDVIFENSPLYKHLSEVGFTDFHAEKLDNCNKHPDSIINEHVTQIDGEIFANRNLKERLASSAKRFISGYFLPSTASEEISCYSFCVAMIKSCALLADDDLELVFRYEHCTDTEYNIDNISLPAEIRSEQNNDKLTKGNDSILFKILISKYMIGTVLLTAIVLGLLFKNTNTTNAKIITFISLLILSVWLPVQWYYLQAKNKIYILKKNVALLLDYIKFSEKLLALNRKVILFIQEKELIAYGHIIINPAVPVTRLENQIKQCMMLRKCVSIEMNSYLGLLYKKMKDISQSTLLDADHGNLNWLQKELNRIENVCLTESEKKSPANEYSLMTLKKIYATLCSRQSSLLCCIAVNLMFEISCLKQSGRKQVNFCQFYSCLEYLLDEVKKCFNNLSDCYKFHKVDIPAHIFDEKKVHKSSNSILYSSFTLALHSMTLHLQQACKTSIDIEEKLDKVITEQPDVTKLPTCSELDEINKQMLFIGQEIEKILVCYEECQSSFEETAVKRSEEQIVKNKVEKANGSSIQHDCSAVQILNIGDEVEPVPDQIFEGETTSDYDDQTQYSTNLGREELRREEKIREEGRHLLKELKSVLATKDEGKMVAIPKVLLKKFNAVKNDGGNTSEGIENSKVNMVNNASTSAVEQTQVVIEVQSLQSCSDEARSQKLCDGHLTVKEHAGNIIPTVTNPPTSAKQSTPGSHNVGNVTNGNNDERFNEFNINNHNEEISQINPFASMVAAAAAARNRQFGVMEESYEIEADTFNNDSDTD